MITNVDHVLALVRGQLERLSRDKRIDPGKKPGRTDTARSTEKSRLQAISNLADISDEEFEHLLVGALLARELGEEAAKDPRFQSVIDRTWTILKQDDGLSAVMQEVRRGLNMTQKNEAGS